MKQLSEDCEKAPLRCVTSLPDIREMDQSNHYPQEDVNDGPECSTPTSTRTIKSFSIANQYVHRTQFLEGEEVGDCEGWGLIFCDCEGWGFPLYLHMSIAPTSCVVAS